MLGRSDFVNRICASTGADKDAVGYVGSGWLDGGFVGGGVVGHFLTLLPWRFLLADCGKFGMNLRSYFGLLFR